MSMENTLLALQTDDMTKLLDFVLCSLLTIELSSTFFTFQFGYYLKTFI